MFLYLLRHADADTIADSDDERSLSAKGKTQAKRIGRFCAKHELDITVVLSSPLLRARQTAELSANALELETRVVPWLASGMRPQTAVDSLAVFRNEPGVMIVGHEPDFSALAAFLLGLASGEQIVVRKGSLICLDITALERGGARLVFSAPNRFL